MKRALYFLLGMLTAAILFGLGMAWRRGDAGTFVTAPGMLHDAGTGWEVVVAADGSRQTLKHGGVSTSPVWVTKPGWFIYLENQTRAWAFNGDDLLLLYVAHPDHTISAYGPDTAPFRVPDEVVHKVGEERIVVIANAAQAARERLGLAPDH